VLAESDQHTDYDERRRGRTDRCGGNLICINGNPATGRPHDVAVVQRLHRGSGGGSGDIRAIGSPRPTTTLRPLDEALQPADSLIKPDGFSITSTPTATAPDHRGWVMFNSSGVARQVQTI
jgi:hypothetical protein